MGPRKRPEISYDPVQYLVEHMKEMVDQNENGKDQLENTKEKIVLRVWENLIP